MRKITLSLGLLLAAAACAAEKESSPPERVTAATDPAAPLWYRDGGERCCWSYGRPTDPAKGKALDELETKIRQLKRGERWPPSVCSEFRRLLLDDDRNVARRAALSCRYRAPLFLPELEKAHKRWPEDSQIERIFVKTAAENWPDERIRSYFWNLPPDMPKRRELYFALHREMARCGTEEDARKLEELLPEGADWRHDPVIARIRLHRSDAPDALAFEILEFLEESPPEKLYHWAAYLYRCELLRYLTLGDDERYRPYIEENMKKERHIFWSDQETYPHGVRKMLADWLEKHPKDKCD